MIRKIILASFLLFAAAQSASAQDIDLYIVISEADWCKYCKANGERIHALIDEYKVDKQVVVIYNDLTNAETKSESLERLKSVGLSEYMVNKKSTGVVYVFEAKSKKTMDNFGIKLESETIVEKLTKNLKKVSI